MIQRRPDPITVFAAAQPRGLSPDRLQASKTREEPRAMDDTAPLALQESDAACTMLDAGTAGKPWAPEP